MSRVLSLSSEIAYALATPDVRIIAPIPGRSAIGVEVPNKVRDFVTLGDVLASRTATEATKPLYVGLGKDVHGRAVLVNLAEMPHLLIAGATGAGKSSCINTFVTSLLVRTSPDDVKMILVDPKRVELSHFADVPHLISPVIVHPKRAAEAGLGGPRDGAAIRAARHRRHAGHRGVQHRPPRGDLAHPAGDEEKFERLTYIVVVIDELADLMMVAPRDVEDAICRIAQMARAVGIHLVVATQRPSVDVVTGLIKANIPSRIAFMTASQADSRVILDVGGAELVGHGDLLFQPANVSKGVRIQGRGSPRRRSRPSPSGAAGSGGRSSTPRSRAWASPPRTTTGQPTRTGAPQPGHRLVVRSAARFDVHAPAQAEGGIRPRGPAHGPDGGAGDRRAEPGIQGPRRAPHLGGVAGGPPGRGVSVGRPDPGRKERSEGPLPSVTSARSCSPRGHHLASMTPEPYPRRLGAVQSKRALRPK